MPNIWPLLTRYAGQAAKPGQLPVDLAPEIAHAPRPELQVLPGGKIRRLGRPQVRQRSRNRAEIPVGGGGGRPLTGG